MSTTLGFKALFDLPMWRPEAPALGVSAAGVSMAWDHRNNANGCPYIYLLRSAAAMEAYDPLSGEWMSLLNPALAGTFGAGACAVFHPSQGPRGVLAAGVWKYYDIATNSMSVSLATANLPATIGTDSNAVALSESHVPYNRSPGEGFISGSGSYDSGKNCIAATATSATTITGSGMFTDLQADEYRNFQIRIVEDSVNPTSVNQRRRISTHTATGTGVFTVAAWTVIPSATAKFVIENDDDKILLRSSAGAAVYNYNITANTWDTTTWAAPVAHGAGVVFEQGFGYTRDAGINARHSHIYCIRGGGVSTIDVLDIAGTATGAWSNDIVYGKKAQTFTTGTSGAYDPSTLQGRLMHININGTQRMGRFDMKNRILDANTYLRYPQSTAIVGQKMANSVFIDGATKANFVYQLTNTQSQMFSLVIQP